MLTDKQIKQFKEDGLVLVPELFNKSEVELILKYTEELQTSPEVSGKEWKYFEKIFFHDCYVQLILGPDQGEFPVLGSRPSILY